MIAAAAAAAASSSSSSSSSRQVMAVARHAARQGAASTSLAGSQRVFTAQSTRRSFSTTPTPRKGMFDSVIGGLNRALRGSIAERARQAGGITPAEARKQAEEQRAQRAAALGTGATGEELSVTVPKGQDEGEEAAYTPHKPSDFERERILARAARAKAARRWGGDRATQPEFHATTGNFRISPRKLKALADQIGGKPIDYAIVQMQFSAKQAARTVHKMLVSARNDAVAEGLDRSRMIVHEAWVGKGQSRKRIDIKGRGRHGVIQYFHAHMDVVLRHGKTHEELLQKRIQQARRRVRSVGTGGVARTHAPPSAASRTAWHY